MDGLSTDRTIHIIRANSENIAFWDSQADSGICQAWNKGLRHARGNWICFLGADDTFASPTVLETVATILSVVQVRTKLVYGEVAMVDRNGIAVRVLGKPCSHDTQRFNGGRSVPHPGLMHHRSLFEQYGGFDESFSIAGDYEFLSRVWKSCDLKFIEGIRVVNMQLGGLSTSALNDLRRLREVRRVDRMYVGIWPPAEWMTSYVSAFAGLVISRTFGKVALEQLRNLKRKISN